MKEIEEVFGFGRLQEVLTILHEMESRGLTVQDLKQYVDERKKEMAKAAKDAEPPIQLCRLCQVCAAPMSLAPVNTGPRDQTGDGSTFVWTCPQCGEEIWTDKPLRKIYELHGRRSSQGADT